MAAQTPDARPWFIALSPDGAAREVGERVIDAFKEELGAERVGVFDTRTYREGYRKLLRDPTDEMVTDLLNQSFAVSCLDFKASRCLILALCPITLFTLNLLRKQGVMTLHWFYEDFRRAAYWRQVVGGYDHFCAIQYGPLPQACAEVGGEFHFLPTAGIIPPSAREHTDRPCDIAFIGVPTPYRIRVLESLARSGRSLACAGAGWEKYRGVLEKCIAFAGWISPEKSGQLLGRAKIGINLSCNSPEEAGAGQIGKRDHNQVSPRAYDIMASGVVLLTEKTPLLADSLSGCLWHEFDSPGDAVAKAAEILSGYDALQQEIDHNLQAVAQRHAFRNRIRAMLAIGEIGRA